MNNVTLIGRLARDPEVKSTSNDNMVANFTLAVDRPMAKEKTADFIRIVCFGKTAELVERYLSKGRQIGVQGHIQTGSYEDKDGRKVYTTDVVASRIEFLGSKEGSAGRSESPEGYTAIDDDDVPF